MPKTVGGKKKSNAEKKAEKQRKLEEAARKAEEERIANERKAKEEEEAAAVLIAKLALGRRKTVARLIKELDAESRRLYLKSQQCLIEESISSSKEEWMRYTACNYLPDVASEAQINTYLSELLDFPSTNMVETLGATNELSKLSHELRRRVFGTALMEEITHSKYQAGEMLQQIRDAALKLLDLQTTDVITHWNKYNAIGTPASGHSGQGVVEEDGGGGTPPKASDRDHLSFHNDESNLCLGIWCNHMLAAFRLKNVDFGRGFNIGIPKPLSTARVALQIIYLPSTLNSVTSHLFFSQNPEWPINGDDELQQHCAPRPRFKQIGGTLYLDILSLPPPAETIGNGWTFRCYTNSDTTTTRLSYPLGGGNVLAAPQLWVSFPIPEFLILPISKANLNDGDGSSMLDNSKSKFCNSGLTVAAWDETLNEWTTNGISDIQWNEKGQNIRFQTYRIGALAVVKDWYLDLPYREWHVQPVYEPLLGTADMSDPTTMEVEIRLITARGHGLQFRVRAGTIKLINPNLPPLAPILGIWMPPGTLLLSLSDTGIDVLPSYSDVHRVMGGIHLARPLEDSLCRNVSELASSFYIRDGGVHQEALWNSNNTCIARKLLFQLKESTAFTGGMNGSNCLDWQFGLVEMDSAPDFSSKNAQPLKSNGAGQQQKGVHAFPKSSLPADVSKYCLLKARIDPAVQLEELENPLAQRHNESHIRLMDCLAAVSDAESIKRVENTSPRLTKTIHQILHSVKLFSFTKHQQSIEASSR